MFSLVHIANAQNLYWRGGTGQWTDNTNWSTTAGGSSCTCIPTSTDNVIINEISGGAAEQVTIPNNFTAVAKSVEVGTNATLHVGSSVTLLKAQLNIEDPPQRGADIYGTVRVYGNLAIRDAPGSGVFVRVDGFLDIRANALVDIRKNNNSNKNGLFNKGRVLIRRNNLNQNGRLSVFDITGTGITNTSPTADFTNRGEIHVEKINTGTNHGILNQSDAVFFNDTTGTILVKNVIPSNVSGIYNSNEFTNAGMITVDGITDGRGISNLSNFNNHGTGNVLAKNVSIVGISNLGFIQNYGNIETKDYSDIGLQNSTGSVFNNWAGGTYISSSTNGSTGIFNSSTFNNRAGSNLIIQNMNSASANGIRNFDDFSNDGNITLHNIAGSAVFNIGNAIFFNIGPIDISETANGIRNKASFTNHGLINIDSCNSHHISLSEHGQLNNLGEIYLNHTDGSTDHAILMDSASLINTSSGELYISNINGSNSDGINATASTISNSGTCILTSINANGIKLKNSDLTNNQKLIMDGTGQNGIEAQGATFSLNNSGDLKIFATNNWAMIIDSNMTFHNSGNIEIDGVGEGIQLKNESIASNSSIASITIKNFFARGIFILSNSHLENLGTLSLNNSILQSDGTNGIYNDGYITNHGDILINNILGLNGTGFRNEDTLSNYGYLYISSTLSSSIFQNEQGVIINQSTGSMDIRENQNSSAIFSFGDITNHGVLDARNIAAACLNIGTLTNKSTGRIFFIPNQNNQPALDNRNVMLNEGCGEIVFGSFIDNLVAASIDNQGYILLNATNPSTIVGNVTNTGLIEDRKGSLKEDYLSILNIGLLVHPLYGLFVLGVPAQGILLGDQLGVNPDNQMYFDSLLTIPMGVYNPVTNTWVPNGFASVDEIWLNVHTTCTPNRVVKIKLQSAIEGNCPSISLEATMESDVDWFNPFLWSGDQVPTYCHDIVIPSGKFPTIFNNNIGYGQTIDIQLGAVLTIDGQLDILSN